MRESGGSCSPEYLDSALSPACAGRWRQWPRSGGRRRDIRAEKPTECQVTCSMPSNHSARKSMMVKRRGSMVVMTAEATGTSTPERPVSTAMADAVGAAIIRSSASARLPRCGTVSTCHGPGLPLEDGHEVRSVTAAGGEPAASLDASRSSSTLWPRPDTGSGGPEVRREAGRLGRAAVPAGTGRKRFDVFFGIGHRPARSCAAGGLLAAATTLLGDGPAPAVPIGRPETPQSRRARDGKGPNFQCAGFNTHHEMGRRRSGSGGIPLLFAERTAIAVTER